MLLALCLPWLWTVTHRYGEARHDSAAVGESVVMLQGRVITMLAGEGHKQDLDDLITAALEVYGERGELSATPLPLTLERNRDTRQADRRLLGFANGTRRYRQPAHHARIESDQLICAE